MAAKGKIMLAQLARLDRREAELHAELADLKLERSKLLAEMSGQDVDLGTGRKSPKRPQPEIPEPTDLVAAKARKALKQLDVRRRVRG